MDLRRCDPKISSLIVLASMGSARRNEDEVRDYSKEIGVLSELEVSEVLSELDEGESAGLLSIGEQRWSSLKMIKEA